MKYTITDRDGTETQIDDYDCDCEGRTIFDIRGTFTVPQMVALANYLAKRACPMSLEEAEDDARTMHEWWRESDQFSIVEGE